jgi:hypothetical protein
MAVRTAAGATISICVTPKDSSAPPANAAAYAALTWVEIGEVQNLGRFGDKANIVSFAALGDNRVRKVKGSKDAGTIALVCGRDPFDAGQIALRDAADTPYEYAIRIVANDALDGNDTPSKYYFVGMISSAEDEYGTVDNVVTLNSEILINSAITYVASAVVP